MAITGNRVHVSKTCFINCTQVQIGNYQLRILLSIRYSGDMDSLQQKELGIIKVSHTKVKLTQ